MTSLDGKVTRCEGRLGSKEQASWEALIPIGGNEKWKQDFSPLDESGCAFVDFEYSRAYVRHLFISKEYLGKQIASIHNLAFYLDLARQARQHILAGDFYEWKDSVVPVLKQRL